MVAAAVAVAEDDNGPQRDDLCVALMVVAVAACTNKGWEMGVGMLGNGDDHSNMDWEIAYR